MEPQEHTRNVPDNPELHEVRFRVPSRPMSRSVASPHVVNIADLRRIAKNRLPRMTFDYIDGGANREITLRDNCAAFDQVLLRPRCAVATPSCDLSTTVLGAKLDLPFILAPVGSSRMFYPRGEEAAARAAGKVRMEGKDYLMNDGDVVEFRFNV